MGVPRWTFGADMSPAIRSEEFIGRYADLQYGGGPFVADLDALPRAPQLGQPDGACVPSEFVSGPCRRDPAAKKETIVEHFGDGAAIAAQPVATMLLGVAIFARPKIGRRRELCRLHRPISCSRRKQGSFRRQLARSRPTGRRLPSRYLMLPARWFVKRWAPAQGRQEVSEAKEAVPASGDGEGKLVWSGTLPVGDRDAKGVCGVIRKELLALGYEAKPERHKMLKTGVWYRATCVSGSPCPGRFRAHLSLTYGPRGLIHEGGQSSGKVFTPAVAIAMGRLCSARQGKLFKSDVVRALQDTGIPLAEQPDDLVLKDWLYRENQKRKKHMVCRRRTPDNVC